MESNDSDEASRSEVREEAARVKKDKAMTIKRPVAVLFPTDLV